MCQTKINGLNDLSLLQIINSKYIIMMTNEMELLELFLEFQIRSCFVYLFKLFISISEEEIHNYSIDQHQKISKTKDQVRNIQTCFITILRFQDQKNEKTRCYVVMYVSYQEKKKYSQLKKNRVMINYSACAHPDRLCEKWCENVDLYI